MVILHRFLYVYQAGYVAQDAAVLYVFSHGKMMMRSQVAKNLKLKQLQNFTKLHILKLSLVMVN